MIKKKKPEAPRKEPTGNHSPEGPQQSKPSKQEQKIQAAIMEFVRLEEKHKPDAYELLEDLLKRFLVFLDARALELVVATDDVTVPFRFLVFPSRLT